MKTKRLLIYFIVLASLIVSCSFLFGCAGAIEAEQKIADEIVSIDKKTHSILAIATTSGKVLHYAAALHKAGVDTEVLQAIKNAMDKVHEIAEKAHQKHVQRE